MPTTARPDAGRVDRQGHGALQRAVELVGRENVYFWVFETNRPVLDLLDDTPLLPPKLLELCRWVADYYPVEVLSEGPDGLEILFSSGEPVVAARADRHHAGEPDAHRRSRANRRVISDRGRK